MELEFLVRNVKCNGCASAIRTELGKRTGVKEIRVDVPTGQVIVLADGDIRAELSAALNALGYPEKT